MNFTVADITGIVMAAALALPLFVLPGLAIARLTGALDYDTATPARKFGIGLLLAHALVPLFAALGLRWLGAPATTLSLFMLGGFAIYSEPRLPRSLLTGTNFGIMATATALFVLLSADLDVAGRLYQSLLATDMFKHALFVRVLADHGAPPVDPFFLRDTPASYYYFYYAPAALIYKAAFGLLDQRAAFVGVQIWTAIATVALVLTVLDRTGLAPGNRSGLLPAALVLMSTAGLQLILVFMNWLKGGMWREQSGWLNDMVNSFLVSAIWVPHHVSAFIAAWVALMFLAKVAGNRSEHADFRISAIALAGAALASMAGQSVWISFGAVATVGVWTLVLAYERRWGAVAAIFGAGAVSLALAAPHLHDMLAYRDASEPALQFKIRYFALAENLASLLGGSDALARFVLLPVNYAFEAAIFVIGAMLFWQRNSLRSVHANELARLLTIGCVSSLLIGSFMASTIGNNDLGWRVVLFAQLAALVWTLAVFAPVWQRAARSASAFGRLRIVPRAVLPLLALGLFAGAHDLVLLRAHHAVNTAHPDAHPVDTAVAHDLRATYAWLDANLPHDAIVQHNPSVIRATGFGLYGRQRVAVSDLHSAALFGASPAEASRRLRDFAMAFDSRADAIALRRMLASEKITALIVTSSDPVWNRPGSWVAAARPVYERPHAKVYLATGIAAGPQHLSGSSVGSSPNLSN